MKEKVKIFLESPVCLVAMIAILIISYMGLNYYDLPPIDLTGMDDIDQFCYRVYSLTMLFSFFIIGILGGFHLANKILEKET